MSDDVVLNAVAQRQVRARGAVGRLRMGPGSELVGLPWHVATAMEGRLFVVNFGTATTPLNWTKTTYDEDQPQAVLLVPSGVVTVPLAVQVQLELSAGTITEIILGTAQNSIGNGTSAAATNGPVNLHSSNPRSSSCTARQLYSANSSALTNMAELKRWVYPFVDTTGDPLKEFEWSYLRDASVPVLKGPASLIVWIAGVGTAPQGFAQMIYAEFDSTDLDGV